MGHQHARRRNIDFPSSSGGVNRLPADDADGGEKHVDPDAANSREIGEESGAHLVKEAAELGGQDFTDPDDRRDAATDAITNILHYAAAEGMNVVALLGRAEDHFTYEQDAIYGDDDEDED